MLLAGGCVALVYLVGVTGRWWPTPDSALYLGLGRSLAEGNGYCFNGSPHNIVTPGLPLILAGLRIVFGPVFWAPNLFMALSGLTAIIFVYLVISRLSDRRMALAVSLAVAFSFVFFHQSHRILSDAPFTALFWALLYAYLRYRAGSTLWLILAALLCATALAIRAPGLIILGSLVPGILLDRPAPETPATTGNDARTPKRRWIRKGTFSAIVILAIITISGGGFYLLAHDFAKGMPVYLNTILEQAGVGINVNLRYLGLGLMQMPFAVSEMLTSQESRILAVLVGLPVLLLVSIGAVYLWRRGQRFILIIILPSVLAFAFCGRDHAIRPRYLLPLQPLFIYTLMEGLCWSVCRICRWRSKPASPVLLLKILTIFTGLIIASNVPKLMRNAFYYSYLGHTPRYYDVVRSGRFAELFPVADILRQGPPLDVPAAVDGQQVSILHFLSERLTFGIPKIACPKTLDNVNQRADYKAETIYEWIKNHPEVGFVAINVSTTVKSIIKEQETKDGKPLDEKAWDAARREFINHLQLRFGRIGIYPVFKGDRYHVYQRVSDLTRKEIQMKGPDK